MRGWSMLTNFYLFVCFLKTLVHFSARFQVFQVVILLRLRIVLNPFFFCWLLPMQAASFSGKYTIGQPHTIESIPLVFQIL